MIDTDELVAEVTPRCEACGGISWTLVVLPSDSVLYFCWSCATKHGAALIAQGAIAALLPRTDGFVPVQTCKIGERA